MSGPEAYSEEALLGAVLQDPRRALEVRDWLRAEDFADPWRKEIYRTLVDHHLYAHPAVLAAPPQQRTQVLGRLVVENLRARAGADGWQVSGADWQQVAAYVTSLPASVPNSANAAQYGRVVAQASLERTVGAQGQFAERAVLAAVLARPEEGARLAGWLKARDFQDPWIGQMYKALVEEKLYAHPAVAIRSSPAERQQVLARMLYEQLQHKAAGERWTVPGSAWPAVAQQIHALTTTQQVPHPEHAAQLGQRVLQTSIQQQVAEGSWRVENTLQMPGAPAAEMEINAMLGTLQRLEDRWEQALGRIEAVGAALAPQASPRPEMSFTEDAVLSSLLRDPRQMEQVGRWLRAEDFTQPGRAQLFTSLQDAAAERGTVDPALVVWDAHRRGAVAPGALAPDQVWAMYQAGRPGIAQAGGRQLVEASIVHHVRSATSAINTAVGDPTAAPGMVIGTARGHLQHASAQAARLTQATWSPARTGQGAR
ncbi:DnaB-like helicase N-terminal domain-containing protein [Streptomyces sp. BE20]|uniref:DnaB-like helicase N-terminal domain-containing protein n=1 Tax=Streptomyces sp. BE20 TaxID=3002525 RepID=UPI002E75B986|nr:DnaB-like helicase N-terminal domain-containing protein [Streptomyces sp. BE20]MEE1822216.1 DnaB-like helicase N-terminal domain-containing protein [Streptomyces sp. BE20]